MGTNNLPIGNNELIKMIQDLFPEQSPQDIENGVKVHEQFPDFLKTTLSLTNMKKGKAEELIKVLESKIPLQITKKEKEEFAKIEKEVLASLSEEQQHEFETIRAHWSVRYGDTYEGAYKQVIMKIYFKEVIIEEHSVKFLYAHKELDKQELQLPITTDRAIVYDDYQGFDGRFITRKEIRQDILRKNSKHYHFIQEGKYIATEENALGAILAGFEGKEDEKIRAIQLLTGLLGFYIVSLEGNEQHCRSIMECKKNAWIFNTSSSNQQGSLLVAKDC